MQSTPQASRLKRPQAPADASAYVDELDLVIELRTDDQRQLVY
jgi:hypothetical protein